MPTPQIDMDLTSFTPDELNAIGAAGPTSGANSGAGGTPVSTATPWLQATSHAIDVTGQVLVAAINGSNETERERIRARATERQAEILNASRERIASDPSGAAALRLQALALQQTIDALQPKSNTLLYVAIGGVGLLAVVAIMYVAMSKRKNPRRGRRRGRRGAR